MSPRVSRLARQGRSYFKQTFLPRIGRVTGGMERRTDELSLRKSRQFFWVFSYLHRRLEGFPVFLCVIL